MSAAPQSDQEAEILLNIVGELARETPSRLEGGPSLTLDTHLERDLGLDSLSKTELLQRLEQRFGASLPDSALAAETPRELLQAVRRAGGAAKPAPADPSRYQAPVTVEETPARVGTLLEVLEWHVTRHPQRIAIYLYGKDDRFERTVSYRELFQGARQVAVGLAHKGLQPGQRVAVMLPTGADYFFGFFGIVLAGGAPVPIYPPARPTQIEEHLRRHGKILANAQTFVLITVPEAKTIARLLKSQVEGLRHIVAVEELMRETGVWARPRIKTQDIAFLQYTSGSTGDPKGVTLTHANLLANLRAIGPRIQVRSTDIFVSWLPLYHDMGLIGAFLGSLYFAVTLVVMSPLGFLARPSRWLWAIHRHRATLSAAPNFAYELCLHSIQDSAIAGLDLSSWRMAFNGAEPVSPDTAERFIRRFGHYGFRSTAMAPVYGLAESSVGLALQPPDRGLVIDRIQREVFASTGQALPAPPEDPNPLRFVACGPPLVGHTIRVVDERGRELPERWEGRLEFQGPSATGGYFRNPEATRRLFHGEWLDSGDRAYLAEGDVYLTGRVKDVIIRGGRNFYPYELEEAIGKIPGVRKGCVAALAGADTRAGTERLVVVAETRQTAAEALEGLRQEVQAATVELLGTPADDIALVPPHTVLKTSSGKIRRAAIRERYERRTLGKGPRALWRQLASLAFTSAIAQTRHGLRRGGDILYAVYAWSVFAALAPAVWIAVVAAPRRPWRWAVVHRVARLLARLTGTSLSVRGLEHLPAGPCILTANHTSYLDALVLAAALPRGFSYVAKQELRRRAVVGLPLKRLDTLFVDRFDIQRGVDEVNNIVQSIEAGHSLAFFPEGTFQPGPGLRPFRMGAFVVAAQTGAPVVPVAIRGPRFILRAGSWRPRRGAVRVLIEAPILPQGNDWRAAVKLRDEVRATILRHCGESDLASP